MVGPINVILRRVQPSNPSVFREYPCGGVDQSKSHTNRTAWPLDGGALVFNPSHDHAQTYVNMGLGNNVTRLNIPLVAAFNQTGKGVFCFPKLTIPADARANITEGVNATIQIIQLGSTGSALYNVSPPASLFFTSTE